MNQELDYAEMLEIPVSTVNVVKKKSINLFKRKNEKAQQPREDLKELVVDSVNERVGAYVYAEDLSDPPEKEKKNPFKNLSKDKGKLVLFTELVAVCVFAIAIFLTNIFMPNSAINTFIGTFTGKPAEVERAYSEFTLSSVISDFSDAEVKISENGVMSFQGKTAVYPVCEGKIASVSKTDDLYTVQIAHTSTFTSVITGLTDVYSAEGTFIAANIPFGYSDGENEVRISLYDGENLLSCFKLMDEVPVWNS